MTQVSDIAVIIPVLNEAQQLDELILRVNSLQSNGARVVIVDGGSNDGTIEQLQQTKIELISSEKGRAKQMNKGWRSVQAESYWFLHADCQPPNSALADIQNTLNNRQRWGRFNVSLSGRSPMFRIIEFMMNWRSCLTQVATGDQGIFVEARLLEEIDGIPDIPLMEDIALSKQLRKHSRGACIKSPMIVSSRRWEKSGIVRMTVLMWWLRLRYFLGANPAELYKSYYG